jgi:hypothetical protein
MSNEVVPTALHEVRRTYSREFDATQQSDVNTPAGIRTNLLTRFTERTAHRGSLDHPPDPKKASFSRHITNLNGSLQNSLPVGSHGKR